MSAKGSQFERTICKKLSLWVTQNLDTPKDDIFWRTSQSGGRATQRAKKNKKTCNAYGDVSFTDPIGKPFLDLFCIELKRGYSKDITIVDFIDKPTKRKTILKFWEQVEKDRKNCNRPFSLLIFKRNHGSETVIIDKKTYLHLKNVCGTWKETKIELRFNKKTFIFLNFEKFFKWFTPEKLALL